MSVRVTVLICALALVHVTVAIKCLSCEHYGGEAECEAVGTNMTCYERLSSDSFQILRKSKSSLEEPRRNTGYQCLEIKVDGSHPFKKGCIYANLDVCKAFPQATYCRTCKDDLCNTIWYKNAASRVGAVGVLVVAWGIVSMVAFGARF